jgi:ketosteroid isomerase-like protein
MSDHETFFASRPAGLDRAEIERRVRRLAALQPRAESDFDLLREFYAPDAACEFIGDKSRIPYAGRHVGVETLIAIVRGIDVDFEQTGHAVHGLVIDGGRAAVRRSVEWRHRGTGRRGRVALADFIRFEYGRIVEMIEFRDSIAILAMQGERVWPASLAMTDPRRRE